MEHEIIMAVARTFWTSFFDGFTGEGIFGDLSLPDAPTRLFKPEPQADIILEIRIEPGAKIQLEEVVRLQAAVEHVVNEAVGERAVVARPESAEKHTVS
jgi:hypothetical protein